MARQIAGCLASWCLCLCANSELVTVFVSELVSVHDLEEFATSPSLSTSAIKVGHCLTLPSCAAMSS